MRKRNSYSRIIQDVAVWGEHHKNFGKGKMIHLLHDCVESNITTFDSTDAAGNGVGRTFGTALSESGLSRDKIQLIGKWKQNLENKSLISFVDNLLQVLKTDYLDLLLLEIPNQPHQLKTDIEKLSSQGKILELGSLNLQEEELDSVRESFILKANLLQIDFFSEEGKKVLNTVSSTSEDIIQIISFNLEKTVDKVGSNNIFREISVKHNLDYNQLLVAWLLQHSMNLHLMINSVEEENHAMLAAAKKTYLSPVDWQKIDLIFS